MAASEALTPKQLDLLHAIRYEQVTWHNRNSRGITYRLWESESIYKVVTPLMNRIPERLFTRQMASGFTFIQRGYCEPEDIARVAWYGAADEQPPFVNPYPATDEIAERVIGDCLSSWWLDD